MDLMLQTDWMKAMRWLLAAGCGLWRVKMKGCWMAVRRSGPKWTGMGRHGVMPNEASPVITHHNS